MLFLGLSLAMIGYPLVWSAMKGENAVVTPKNGQQEFAFQAPWLLFLVPFGGAQVTDQATGQSSGNQSAVKSFLSSLGTDALKVTTGNL